MKATVEWQEKLSFKATSDTGYSQTLASGGDSLSPMEAVLQAVGSCSSVDVVMILEKGRSQIHSCVCELSAERASDHPRVFEKIHLHFKVKADNLTQTQLERACHLSIDKYCSVALMLVGRVAISHSCEMVS